MKNIDCRKIFEKLNDYLDEELDPSLCDQINEHLEDCEPCMAFVNTLAKTILLAKDFKDYSEKKKIPADVHDSLIGFLKENLDIKLNS